MKKVKRTRKQGSEQSLDKTTGEITPKSDGFSFNDLPLNIQVGVDRIIEMRKCAGLFDDSVERKQRAIRYFRGSGLRVMWEERNGCIG